MCCDFYYLIIMMVIVAFDFVITTAIDLGIISILSHRSLLLVAVLVFLPLVLVMQGHLGSDVQPIKKFIPHSSRC